MSSQTNKHIDGQNHSFFGKDNRCTTTEGPTYETKVADVRGISNVGTTHNSYAEGTNHKVFGVSYSSND